ncbi:hypothetical protein ACS0TY_033961 [Phlomoides rotata]
MPPEISHCLPIITPKTPVLSRVPSKSRFILHPKYCQGRMKFTKKKLIPVLVFVLFSASLFRFLNISMIAIFSVPQPRAALPPAHQHECFSASSVRMKDLSHPLGGSENIIPPKSRSSSSTNLTEKEMQFLLGFFSQRVPCNLLVFGSEYQYSGIASLNKDGVTIFLEDYLQNTSPIKSRNNTQVHKIMYNTKASEAYQLLKEARENPKCLPTFHLPEVSKCNLQLLNLPQEVYDTMWDVVMVDGPFGGTPDSPGRMASIYTASLLARRENVTHVFVHDVDRMIEMWFSWEFLCEENLVSSKGRFWHFQILRVPNATTFCTP